MYCIACGTPNPDLATFCQQCGTRLQGEPLLYEPKVQTQRPASVGSRLGAVVIDGLLTNVASYVFLGVIIRLVIGPLTASFLGRPLRPEDLQPDFLRTQIPMMLAVVSVAFVALTIPQWLYYALQESSEARATVGKRTMGLVITDLEGRRISFGRASLRYWAKFVISMVPLVNIANLIVMLVDGRNQALHDKAAGTLPVQIR